jgi:hypothetical protein
MQKVRVNLPKTEPSHNLSREWSTQLAYVLHSSRLAGFSLV